MGAILVLLTFGEVMQCSKRRPGAADLHVGPGIQGVPVGRAPSPDRLGLPLLIQISLATFRPAIACRRS